MSFLIVTGPVRSGKTTALSDWLRRYNRAGGFLTPDGADGLRLFYDVAADRFLPFEISGLAPAEPKVCRDKNNVSNRSGGAKPISLAPPERFAGGGSELQTLHFSEAHIAKQKISLHSSPEIVDVGRFRFWKSSFDHGNDLLLKASETDYDVVALDEWGKLELRGKGFAEGAENVVKKALSGALDADLIVVVRDYLLDDFYAWCKSLIPAEEVLCSPKTLDLPTG